MANLNKVHLIGRLTRDPERKEFQGGGAVVNFGLAVNNRRKNRAGEWEDEPCFLDCKAFNSQWKKLGDVVDKYCSKGKQIYVGGHLVLEQWTTQGGEKRQKLVIVVDEVQLLDSRGGGQGDRDRGDDRGGEDRGRDSAGDWQGGGGGGPPEEEIPF